MLGRKGWLLAINERDDRVQTKRHHRIRYHVELDARGYRNHLIDEFWVDEAKYGDALNPDYVQWIERAKVRRATEEATS